METSQSHQFSPSRTSYSLANAHWMARVAAETYQDSDEDILQSLQGADQEVRGVFMFDKSSSQGIVLHHASYVVASFRGTDELADWWDNVNALPTRGPFGRVHRGFQEALMDIWPAMRAKIRAIRQKESVYLPLWFTGHSLGGAMATLAAAQLIEVDEPFYGVYTFGQPRCGDRDFALRFNVEAKNRFFRFQNNNDIVTRIPARIMGYSHVGTFRYIDEGGDVHEDIGFWYKFLDGVKGVMNDFGEKGLDAIEDHKMEDYLRWISAAAEGPQPRAASTKQEANGESEASRRPR